VNGEYVPRAGRPCTDCKNGIDHRSSPPKKCLEGDGTGAVVSDEERSRLKLEHMLSMELPVSITGKVGRLMADEAAVKRQEELAALETAFYAERGIRARGGAPPLERKLTEGQQEIEGTIAERLRRQQEDPTPRVGDPCIQCRDGIDWLKSPTQKCLECNGTGMVVSEEERSKLKLDQLLSLELPVAITGKVGQLMADEAAAERRKELVALETAFYAERGIRAKGRKGRWVLIHPQEALLQQARALQQSAGWWWNTGWPGWSIWASASPAISVESRRNSNCTWRPRWPS